MYIILNSSKSNENPRIDLSSHVSMLNWQKKKKTIVIEKKKKKKGKTCTALKQSESCWIDSLESSSTFNKRLWRTFRETGGRSVEVKWGYCTCYCMYTLHTSRTMRWLRSSDARSGDRLMPSFFFPTGWNSSLMDHIARECCGCAARGMSKIWDDAPPVTYN